MKILWIATYPVSGMSKVHPVPWVTTLAKELVNKSHQLTIVTLSSKIEEEELIIEHQAGYKIVVVKYQGGVMHLLSLFRTRIIALEKYLEKHSHKFDLIHVHGTEHQFATSVSRIKRHIPVIISIQGIISEYRKEVRNRFSKTYLFWSISSIYERKEIKHFNHFFCRTHWDQACIRKLNKKATIDICWETMRSEFFDFENNFSGNDILFIGGNKTLKALDICLKVFNQLLTKVDCKLHIVGLTEFARINILKRKLGLDNINRANIVLHGSLNAKEICKLYKKCFCLYHPSLIDNSPNTVCEAQVAGLPVIATNVGGVSSLIKDGETGILVRKNNVAEHAAALEKLYYNDELRKQLSRNALLVARRRHDNDSIVSGLLDAYQNLLPAPNTHVTFQIPRHSYSKN